MALSDCFPYGAPELLEGASARMARSTMTASLVVALLIASAGAMLSRQVTVVIDPGSIPRDPIDLLNLRELMPPPEDGPPVPPTEVFPTDVIPIPVPDELATIVDLVDPVLPNDGPAGDPTDIRPRGSATRGGEGIVPVRDPEPGEFVEMDEMPAKIRCADTVYPDLARSAGVEGTVHVRMLVGLNGRVERAIVAPKGSIPMLDQAALDAALTCVFTPALSNGHPVKVWVSQGYRFILHPAR